MEPRLRMGLVDAGFRSTRPDFGLSHEEPAYLHPLVIHDHMRTINNSNDMRSIRKHSSASTTALTWESLNSYPPSCASSAPDQDSQVDEEEKDLSADDDDDDEIQVMDDNEPGMTPSERRDARKRMKRFRLTHQQTRFLMSEFAKQPHPDVAHRERLSKEIPGLTPRQVQVWFQNRRAKIKRLTTDDRERMLRMRAVPDDFDNVKALHSPYGVVPGTPTTPAQALGNHLPSLNDHLIRPLTLDTMRIYDNEMLSPCSDVSSSPQHAGYAPSKVLDGRLILSPISIDSHCPSNPTSPVSIGPPARSLFPRHNSLHTMPPLRPLQIRDEVCRSRSESVHSPLRTSMSWKGENLGYDIYQAQTSRSTSYLQGDNVLDSRQDFDESFSSEHFLAPQVILSGLIRDPTDPGMSSSSSQLTYASSLQQASENHSSPTTRTHLQSSAPTGFHSLPSRHTMTHPSIFVPSNGRFINTPNNGFASAPLTAPSDFALPYNRRNISSQLKAQGTSRMESETEYAAISSSDQSQREAFGHRE